ncbi:MAG: hypothetical protein GY854_24710 [Deltaproteobacteria bacterium]|nr:hypothetical protein [Deltaproteobacteria bacterium]
MEIEGWTTKVVGYEHNYLLWGLFLDTDIVVCYEKAHAQKNQTGKEPQSSPDLKQAGLQ